MSGTKKPAWPERDRQADRLRLSRGRGGDAEAPEGQTRRRAWCHGAGNRRAATRGGAPRGGSRSLPAKGRRWGGLQMGGSFRCLKSSLCSPMFEVFVCKKMPVRYLPVFDFKGSGGGEGGTRSRWSGQISSSRPRLSGASSDSTCPRAAPCCLLGGRSALSGYVARTGSRPRALKPKTYGPRATLVFRLFGQAS